MGGWHFGFLARARMRVCVALTVALMSVCAQADEPNHAFTLVSGVLRASPNHFSK